MVLALVLGCAAAGAAGLVLARWCGWRRLPAVLAGCGLALALAVTLARPGVLGVTTLHPLQLCVLNDFSLIGSLARLNFLMLGPFAFFGTLATRKPGVVLLACAAVSGDVELAQAVTAVGVCEAQDFYNNTIGAVFAVLFGWLFSWAFGGGAGKLVAKRESAAR